MGLVLLFIDFLCFTIYICMLYIFNMLWETNSYRNYERTERACCNVTCPAFLLVIFSRIL